MRMTEQEFQNRYKIRILEPTMNVETFHCGDEDLDDFIINEASLYGKARIGMMYLDLGAMANEIAIS